MEAVILEKAKSLFFSYGIRSISLDDLGYHTGISKKTIYQYFTDKNDILNHVVDTLIKSHHTLFTQCQLESMDAIQEVILQSNSPLHTWTSVSPVFFKELEKSFPQAWEKLNAHKRMVFRPGIIKNLERGIREGLYRGEINIPLTADIRVFQLESALNPAIITSQRINTNELVHALTELYLHGITTEKGRKTLLKHYSTK